ncbi:MAG: hypothetical protein E7453_00635 [Ruminococcaceae bacterium]|nr:hypothetical protein [Oscillospiraceae bacterium]
MSEYIQGCMRCGPEDLQNALPIHTRKITDSCRDKDCIESLRVYLTRSSQAILETAAGAKVRCADLVYAAVDVEPVAFDRNHYCVDVTFYYRVLADATIGTCRPAALYGLAVFSKRAVLCGEESSARIFSSADDRGASLCQNQHYPTAIVEALDPMILSSRVKELGDCGNRENTVVQIPANVLELFDDELVLAGERRRLYVSLGQFSIIRLERDAQIIVPFLDYSLPTKNCCDAMGCAEDPCEMFSRIPFPAGQFTPKGCDPCDGKEYESEGGCSRCYTTTADM